jgi:hypothetical protein
MQPEKNKKYYDTHREEIIRKKREYREKNREKIREQDRLRYKENPEKGRTKSKKYRENNLDKIKQYLDNTKEKRLKYYKDYRELHKDNVKEWYQKNRDRILQRNQEYRKNNPDMMRKHNKNFVINTRNKLFEILGGKLCIGCGETDERCLQFDHINGGGRKDVEKHKSSSEMYRYYIANPDIAKETLQVMCANCNWKKKFDNNESTFKFPPID